MQKQILPQLKSGDLELSSINLEKAIAEELERETREMKESLETTVLLQEDLINQLKNDQEVLDSIESHILNSKENLKSATNKLEESEKNVASFVNPFKNIMNIVNLLSPLSWFKKN